MNDEPTRLADLRDAPSPEAEFMGDAIRVLRRLRPPDGKMDELAARLGPVLEEKPASPARAIACAGAALVTIAVATFFALGPSSMPPKPDEAPTRVTAPAQPHEVSPPFQAETNTPLDIPPSVPVQTLPSVNVPSVNAQKATAPARRCDELTLVDAADTELRAGNSSGAFAIAREHEQRCPTNALAQERERIAIEALTRLGRRDEALARAHAFEERFPASPHLRRVRKVVERLAP